MVERKLQGAFEITVKNKDGSILILQKGLKPTEDVWERPVIMDFFRTGFNALDALI